MYVNGTLTVSLRPIRIMECLKVICLVICFIAVCSEKTRPSNKNNKNNTISHIEVMVRPLNKKITKTDVSHNQNSKHRSGKVSQVVNSGDNKTTVVNGVYDLLRNIGINLSTNQSNKLYNFIPYPVSGLNTVFRILIYPKNNTQPNSTHVLSDDTLKNNAKPTPTSNNVYYENDDDCTRRISLPDAKEYKLKDALLEKTLNLLPNVDHGSVQSGKTFHIKDHPH